MCLGCTPKVSRKCLGGPCRRTPLRARAGRCASSSRPAYRKKARPSLRDGSVMRPAVASCLRAGRGRSCCTGKRPARAAVLRGRPSPSPSPPRPAGRFRERSEKVQPPPASLHLDLQLPVRARVHKHKAHRRVGAYTGGGAAPLRRLVGVDLCGGGGRRRERARPASHLDPHSLLLCSTVVYSVDTCRPPCRPLLRAEASGPSRSPAAPRACSGRPGRLRRPACSHQHV